MKERKQDLKKKGLVEYEGKVIPLMEARIKGGLKGKEHGIKGKESGLLGKDHGILGKEHGNTTGGRFYTRI